VDSSGNVYVADFVDSRVFEVVAVKAVGVEKSLGATA
jgi:hypothetical protein